MGQHIAALRRRWCCPAAAGTPAAAGSSSATAEAIGGGALNSVNDLLGVFQSTSADVFLQKCAGLGVQPCQLQLRAEYHC